jgi:hypothetical protein
MKYVVVHKTLENVATSRKKCVRQADITLSMSVLQHTLLMDVSIFEKHASTHQVDEALFNILYTEAYPAHLILSQAHNLYDIAQS